MEFILFRQLVLCVLFEVEYFIELTEHHVRVMESSSAFLPVFFSNFLCIRYTL